MEDVFGIGGARELITGWGRLWGVPSICSGLEFSFSARMRARLGSCHPSRRKITLNAILARPENRAVAVEVLCHEAAHLAASDLFGRGIKPHGSEWKALMRAASFVPRVRFDPSGIDGLARERRRRFTYHHVCGDCGARFASDRTDRRWRCRSCYSRTGGGRLRVVREASGSP